MLLDANNMKWMRIITAILIGVLAIWQNLIGPGASKIVIGVLALLIIWESLSCHSGCGCSEGCECSGCEMPSKVKKKSKR